MTNRLAARAFADDLSAKNSLKTYPYLKIVCMVSIFRPFGAAKGLNTETVKRFSDCDLVGFGGKFRHHIFQLWRIAAKRLVISTNVTSKTPLKIQFCIKLKKNPASHAPRARRARKKP